MSIGYTSIILHRPIVESMAKVYAYKRVSTADQNLDRQLPDLKADVEFTEKVSAKDAKRPELELMLRVLAEGDSIHVHELSRLARSVMDLTKIVRQIVDAGATIHFHKEGLMFGPDSEANSFQSLMLNMLGAIAQFERDLMLERQREGISAAKAKGVYKGRQSKFTDEELARIREEFSDSTDKAKLARRWKISRSYLYKIGSRQETAASQ